MASRRHAADEDAGILCVRLHAHAIAEHGASAVWARGINGNDADRSTRFAPARDQSVDQRALPSARRAGDSHQKRTARLTENLGDERRAGVRIVFHH
jgi:hypothetical protein